MALQSHDLHRDQPGSSLVDRALVVVIALAIVLLLVQLAAAF